MQDDRKSFANSLIETFQDVAEGKRALSIDYTLDELDWSSKPSQRSYLEDLVETLFEVALEKQVIPDVYYTPEHFAKEWYRTSKENRLLLCKKWYRAMISDDADDGRTAKKKQFPYLLDECVGDDDQSKTVLSKLYHFQLLDSARLRRRWKDPLSQDVRAKNKRFRRLPTGGHG